MLTFLFLLFNQAMLDFSLAELGVVGLVALLLLGPEDLAGILKAIKTLKSKIKDFFTDRFPEVTEAIYNDKVIDLMVDSDGNLQKMYDNKKLESSRKQEKSDDPQ